MFTSRPSLRELQAENDSLRAALEQAKASLAEFRLQEHDLVDVLVGARTEARDLIESARTEARDRVESARAEARDLVESARTEARGLVDRATEEARQLRDAAQSEVDATLAEIGNTERQLLRLRGVQRELEASLQESLAALAPVLSFAAEAAPRPAARVAPVATGATAAAPEPLAPVPLAPVPAAPVPEAPVLEAPVPTAPVPMAPAPVATVPRAPVPVVSVPVAPVPAGPADSVPPPEMTSTGALEIFPREIAAFRPFQRHRPRVEPPPARKWPIRLPQHGPVATAVAACAVMGIAAVAWSTWGARDRADQTAAAAMVSSAAPAASSPAPTPALRTAETPGAAVKPAKLARGTETPPPHTVGRPAHAASGLFTVVVEAVRPVWLRADADGKRELARTVRAGERVELHAAHEVTLRAGDAGAVLTSVNGGATAPLGANGAVITRRIAGPAARTPRPGASPGTQRLLETAARPEPTGDSSGRLPAAVAAPSAQASGAQPQPVPTPGSQEPPLTMPDIPLSTSPSGPALASPGPRMAASSTAPAPAGNAAPSQAASSPLTPAETEVFGAHETYFEALRRGDETAMRKVRAPSFTSTGVPAPTGNDSLAVNSISVQVSGVGAVVSGVASRRDSGADGRTTQLLFSEVWTNADGQWQLLSVRFIEAPRK